MTLSTSCALSGDAAAENRRHSSGPGAGRSNGHSHTIFVTVDLPAPGRELPVRCHGASVTMIAYRKVMFFYASGPRPTVQVEHPSGPTVVVRVWPWASQESGLSVLNTESGGAVVNLALRLTSDSTTSQR